MLDAAKGSGLAEQVAIVPKRSGALGPSPALVPVSDAELDMWAPQLAQVLPSTWDDLDVSFVYRKWASEVVTTRRSDHNAAYRVVWAGFIPDPSAQAAIGSSSSLNHGLNSVLSGSVHASVAGSRRGCLYSDLGPDFGPGTMFSPRLRPLLAGTEQAPGMLGRAIGHLSPWRDPMIGTGQRGFSDLLVRLGAVDQQGRKFGSLPTAGYLEPATAPEYDVIAPEMGNQRRLRVTKGVVLPSDVAIHLICASKDVIHSWAIPGLGIKIDCIPGYNSHRRLLVRWRGTYWGQCMEVCGRYHHWMPILVQVAHRDAFIAWCLAFIKISDAVASAGTRAA